MYKISVKSEKSKYDLSELAHMFMPREEFVMETDLPESDIEIYGEDKNENKRRLYDFLSEKTGKRPDWGILTGVRPSKLYNELAKKRLKRR